MKNMTKHRVIFGGLLVLFADLALAATIFTPGSQPTGWVSRPEVSYYDISSGTETFYQVDFRKNTWAGNALAKDINSAAIIQSTGPWDPDTAASLLDSADYSTGRKIATFGGTFGWGTMSATEKNALGSVDVLNFVRGDRSNEEPNGKSFYKRESVLGNIMHSNIAHVDDGTNRTLYVGSNDGMLHAFDATTGAEKWAYIPRKLIPNLEKLTRKNFVHTYFVDGPISVATFGDTNKTILVSALGAGGAGLFALDITTATAVSEAAVVNKVLWEISPSGLLSKDIAATGDFSNLGHTFGTPEITRLNDGTAAVIIGNGYMNQGNGHAVLYVINAMTGALISAIDTGSGSSASPNGLSSPTLYDVNGDARPEYAYAGDIDGNLWKFDLTTNEPSLVMFTSPAQAITTAPVVRPHPKGGQMIVFATGRILTSGDETDESIHYAYGIWDGRPGTNTRIVTQELSESTSNDFRVRTVTNKPLDWAIGGDAGWKVALTTNGLGGERVVGEKPFYNNGRIYFVSTNPKTNPTENWLHELVFNTGGSPLDPIFDLSENNSFGSEDLAANNGVPVAKYLGAGAFSQPLLVNGVGFSTTLYAYHQNLEVTDDVDEPVDPGVSGGHFDFDIYYYGNLSTEQVTSPTSDSKTDTICMKTSDIEDEYNKVANKSCKQNADIPEGYIFLTSYTTGGQDDNCKGGGKKYQQVVCNTVITESITSGDYFNKKHEHEYDDKYDVTGVNMLNASLVDFNLAKAITDTTTEFKVLVMNQYLNPAALLSVGNVTDYESVKTFGNLASETNAVDLLTDLPTFTRADVTTLIYNLPLDAFKSKDWWGDGGETRAGLIPTETKCVDKVKKDGSMLNSGTEGLFGPNGERFNGALTIQIIKADTPPGQLELNGPDVKYGWRVKQSQFTKYVLAEYTSFWHHPNKFCYGKPGWIADPPEDFVSDADLKVAAVGSADPKDGIFGAGLAVISTEVNTVGGVTTTVTTYSDLKQYIKTETVNDDGTITVTQTFRDGTEVTTIISRNDGGQSGSVDPNTGSVTEEPSVYGRESWRDIIN